MNAFPLLVLKRLETRVDRRVLARGRVILLVLDVRDLGVVGRAHILTPLSLNSLAETHVFGLFGPLDLDSWQSLTFDGEETALCPAETVPFGGGCVSYPHNVGFGLPPI